MSYAHLDEYSRSLRGAHEAVAAGQDWPHSPRRLIMASWRRSLEADINPEKTSAPSVLDASHIEEVRQAHPLRP
ncbi:transcriptional regulator, partial [Nonomuraea sp. KC401]